MKKLLLLVLLLSISYSNGQVFYMDLMKVESADQAQFENVQLNHYQKVAQDAVDKGNLINWVMLRKVSGIGNYEGPNYIFVNGFQKIENITEDELWYNANNTKKVLGIDPSLLTSGGTHLGRYFYKQEDYLDSGKMGKYVIMNRAKPTNSTQFIEENRSLWKPYFKKTMEKRGSTGWGIASRIAPYYEDSSTILTWDAFDSMTNVMKYLAGEFPLPASIANKTKMGDLMPNGFKAIEIWEIIGSTK